MGLSAVRRQYYEPFSVSRFILSPKSLIHYNNITEQIMKVSPGRQKSLWGTQDTCSVAGLSSDIMSQLLPCKEEKKSLISFIQEMIDREIIERGEKIRDVAPSVCHWMCAARQDNIMCEETRTLRLWGGMDVAEMMKAKTKFRQEDAVMTGAAM